jgi:hypothetical protein
MSNGSGCPTGAGEEFLGKAAAAFPGWTTAAGQILDWTMGEISRP